MKVSLALEKLFTDTGYPELIERFEGIPEDVVDKREKLSLPWLTEVTHADTEKEYQEKQAIVQNIFEATDISLPHLYEIFYLYNYTPVTFAPLVTGRKEASRRDYTFGDIVFECCDMLNAIEVSDANALEAQVAYYMLETYQDPDAEVTVQGIPAIVKSVFQGSDVSDTAIVAINVGGRAVRSALVVNWDKDEVYMEEGFAGWMLTHMPNLSTSQVVFEFSDPDNPDGLFEKHWRWNNQRGFIGVAAVRENQRDTVDIPLSLL